jgi:hypothetical protein
MLALSAGELLSVWEQSFGQPRHERALRLLATTCPETSFDELAALSIGQRDARLLRLREWTFGEGMDGLTTCPACDSRLELSFNVAEIQIASEAAPVETLSLTLGDYDIRFRLPDSRDIAAITGSEDVAAGQRQLLERCLLSIRHCDVETNAEDLPDEVLEETAARMGAADPQADVQLSLACVQCGHQWQSIFDIESFFWSEIQAWAERILREVHTLAGAYGWREADILAMSPRRRQIYLEMLSG